MSRILYVRELGSDGQVGGFAAVAGELRYRGHEVAVAVRDLPGADAQLGPQGIDVHQAPMWLRNTDGSSAAVNYSELLSSVGFLDERALTGMARGWRELLTRVAPDLLVVDHAPTALLAVRAGVRCARVTFGTGFSSPPRGRPLPSFCPWLDVPDARLAEADRRLLDVLNGVAHRLGAAPLTELADLFQADDEFLCTFPELDHYPSREGGRYWGPTIAADGPAPRWPEGRGAKIFASVSPAYAGGEALLEALGKLPHRTLIQAPNVGHAIVMRPERVSNNRNVSVERVNAARALAEAALVISHGGHGTVAHALLAGLPLLLLPISVEQLVTSRVVIRLGAGKMVNPDARNPAYSRLVMELLRDATYADRARAFARAHGDFDVSTQAHALADRCEALLQM